jgi:hypothetical protein
MTADELRKANIDHFRKLLERTADADERARIERLLAEEQGKPGSAYPEERAG